MISNKQYKCIISSLDNSLDNYSINKKTYGSLELISNVQKAKYLLKDLDIK